MKYDEITICDISLEDLQKALKAKMRKPRSDKGKKRGPNSKPRSDKGEQRAYYSSNCPETAKYARLKSLILNREYDPNLFVTSLSLDINGYFEPLIKKAKTVNEEKTYISRGKKVNRSHYQIAGSRVDLEEYRFNALQELALLNEPLNEKNSQLFSMELRQTSADNFVDCFTRFYHIAIKDFPRWTYSHWREDYNIVAFDRLAKSCDDDLHFLSLDEFAFDIAHQPGSAEFLPEYKLQKDEYINRLKQSIRESKDYKVEESIYHFRLSHAEDNKNLPIIEEQYPELKYSRLAAKLKEVRDVEKINKELEEHMNEWLENKVKEMYDD